jgi:hypothetical protein
MALISTNAEINKIFAKVQGSDPTGDPASGYAWIFIKADGLYIELDTGTVMGPFAEAGAPAAHASSHQNAGGDEISVAGLSGVLADGQTPVNHDHSGDAGDGSTFDAANLTSGSATAGDVLTADGVGGAAWVAPAASSGTLITMFTVEGTLTVASSPLRIYNCFGATRTISKVFISVNTAPTGASILVDVNLDGTTIFSTQSNRPAITATNFTGVTTTIDVASWQDGHYLTVDVDQIGSTIAGANLTIHIVHA